LYSSGVPVRFERRVMKQSRKMKPPSLNLVQNQPHKG
jgi:hypothetical protein